MCVDVVESVRLIEDDEEGAVRRWQTIVDRACAEVLPLQAGRLVKSLGDGMLLDFPRVQPAIASAFAIQRICADASRDLPEERRMYARMGVHAGEIIADEHDVYGHGVNLAARLATLAGPGEIVVSAAVRDQLVPQLDADVEDLGECYLKHVREPVRAYRVGPPGARPVIQRGSQVRVELQPTVAVIPFAQRGGAADHAVLGEVLADEIIAALSRSANLRVISRLSTTVFRGRDVPVADVGAHLAASYVVSGTYRIAGRQVAATVELVEAKTGYVVWSDVVRGEVEGVLRGEDALVATIVAGVGDAVLSTELRRAQTQALPTLEACTLLLGAVSLMHRLSARDFERAEAMLRTLTERAPRLAVPQAWLAKWHVLRVQQGWSPDTAADARAALDCTRRALDDDPECSLALAVDGFVHTNLLKRLDIAEERYARALAVNPNDSLAWLLKGTMHAFRGEAAPAVAHTAHARALSPLDPLRYFFDSLSATAALAAKDYEQAHELALRSYRANRKHASTLRALAIAQWQTGRHDEARRTVTELLTVEPSFTVSRFVARSPSTGFETGRIWAQTLREAGVPE